MSTVKTSDVRPGEHVSTAPKPEPRALKEEIAWSRKAVEHLALLQQSTTQSPSPTAGQSPEEPKLRFEEAAIRPCTPEQQRMTDPPPGAKGGGNLRTIELTPGRFYARCMTVAWLINIAHRPLLKPGTPVLQLPPPSFGQTSSFGVDSGRSNFESLRGGPEWILTDGYMIEAITDGSKDASTMQHRDALGVAGTPVSSQGAHGSRADSGFRANHFPGRLEDEAVSGRGLSEGEIQFPKPETAVRYDPGRVQRTQHAMGIRSKPPRRTDRCFGGSRRARYR